MYHLGHVELHAKRKMVRHELEIISAARVRSLKQSKHLIFYSTVKSLLSRLPFSRPIFARPSHRKQIL
ncbi:MAG: hypothetical protein WCI18_00955 [Pseudomonadota bacterium]